MLTFIIQFHYENYLAYNSYRICPYIGLFDIDFKIAGE